MGYHRTLLAAAALLAACTEEVERRTSKSSSDAGPAACQDSCSLGQAQCVGARIASCRRQADGCLAFDAASECGGGLFCSGGACGSTCSSPCALGAKRCQGTWIQACETAVTGCADWGLPVPCASGACSGDVCPGPACTDRCVSGARRCSVTTAQEICRISGSGCLEWASEACPEGQTCTSDRCAAVSACATGCPAGWSCSAGGACEGGSSTDLVLDVRTVSVSGRVTFNGAAPSVEENCLFDSSFPRARVRFAERTLGYSFEAPVPCSSAAGEFTAVVYPGTYRVSVEGQGREWSNLPEQAYVAATALAVGADRNNLVFDVQTRTVSGRVTLNGAFPTAGPECPSDPTHPQASVRLVEPTLGYVFEGQIPCSSSSAEFSGLVYPGTYRVSVEGAGEDYTNLPSESFLANSALAVGSDRANLIFDVKTWAVSGKVTFNGALPASCLFEFDDRRAYVRFVEPALGYDVRTWIPCDSPTASFDLTLFPGTYWVTVTGGFADPDIPDAAYLAHPALLVNGNRSNEIYDVRTVSVAGRVTLNGAGPSVGESCWGGSESYWAAVVFSETETGASFMAVIPCSSTDAVFAATIYPGTYRVTVEGEGPSWTNLPDEPFLAREAAVLSASRSDLVYDVKTWTVSGRFTLNGAAPTKAWGCQPSSTVQFREPAQGYLFHAPIFCDSPSASFGAVLFPGAYQVSVQASPQHWEGIPAEPYLADPSLQVAANLSNLILDVETRPLGGRVTLNGALPSTAPGCEEYPWVPKAEVQLTEETRGYSFQSPIPCWPATFLFGTTVYPGTYRVTVGATESRTNLPTEQYVGAAKLVVP